MFIIFKDFYSHHNGTDYLIYLGDDFDMHLLNYNAGSRSKFIFNIKIKLPLDFILHL